MAEPRTSDIGERHVLNPPRPKPNFRDRWNELSTFEKACVIAVSPFVAPVVAIAYVLGTAFAATAKVLGV